MQGATRDRRRQYRPQMRRQIVFPAVEQVLQVRRGLGFALDGEASLEEERVGVFPAPCECDEVGQPGPHRHLRRMARTTQPARDNLEREREQLRLQRGRRNAEQML